MPSQSSKSSKTPEPKKNGALKGASPKSSSPPSVKQIKKGKSGKAEAKPKFETLLKNLPLTERRLLQARNGVRLCSDSNMIMSKAPFPLYLSLKVLLFLLGISNKRYKLIGFEFFFFSTCV